MTPFQARWRQHEADTMPEISPENIHREVDKKCEPLTNIPSEYPGVGVKAEMKGGAGREPRAFYTSWML